jgi:hypothetical protein
LGDHVVQPPEVRVGVFILPSIVTLRLPSENLRRCVPRENVPSGVGSPILAPFGTGEITKKRVGLKTEKIRIKKSR